MGPLQNSCSWRLTGVISQFYRSQTAVISKFYLSKAGEHSLKNSLTTFAMELSHWVQTCYSTCCSPVSLVHANCFHFQICSYLQSLEFLWSLPVFLHILLKQSLLIPLCFSVTSNTDLGFTYTKTNTKMCTSRNQNHFHRKRGIFQFCCLLLKSQ